MPVHDWTRVVELGEFHDFHLGFITTLRNTLNTILRPTDYYASAEGRIMGYEPDASAFERRIPREVSRPQSSGGVAVQSEILQVTEVSPRTRFIDEADHWNALRESYVAIRNKRGDRLVAIVEVVSPRNKDRADAIQAFGNKLEKALEAGCNVLVADFLRPGNHDPYGMHYAFWTRFSESPHGVTPQEPIGIASYHAPMNNVQHEPLAYFESVAIGYNVPSMPLFLDSGEYIHVPIQNIYDEAVATLPPPYQEDLNATKTP